MKQGGRIFYMGAGTSGTFRRFWNASKEFSYICMAPTLVIGLICRKENTLCVIRWRTRRNNMERGWEEL